MKNANLLVGIQRNHREKKKQKIPHRFTVSKKQTINLSKNKLYTNTTEYILFINYFFVMAKSDGIHLNHVQLMYIIKRTTDIMCPYM